MDNSAYPYAEAGLRGARREARGEEGSTRSRKATTTTAGGRRNPDPQLRSGRAAPRGRLPPHAPSSSESSETSASSLAAILSPVQTLSAAPPPRAPLAPVNLNSVSFPPPSCVETGCHWCIHACFKMRIDSPRALNHDSTRPGRRSPSASR